MTGAGPAGAQGLEIVERKMSDKDQRRADDLLVLRDGGMERGGLTGCAGDSCTIGAASVPRERIAWIGLEAGEDSPPGGQDTSIDEVHLRDGSVHPGRLVGVSRHEVVTERGGHPRHEVAWIHFAGEEDDFATAPSRPENGPGQADDALILREGEVRQGELKGCDPGSCTFDGASLPRTTIAWIGLGVDEPTPPGAQDPSIDEVHLRDGSVHAGRLLEIFEGSVATEYRRHPRTAVAWVHLAGEPISPIPPGSVEHLYDAVIKVNVVEKLDYRDSAADFYPPCETGTAERRVRWTAKLPARYSRVDMREVMEAAAKQAEAAGLPDIYSLRNGANAGTEVLSSDHNGETRFDLFEERVDQKWFVWAEGMCTTIGSYRPHSCTRSLTGKPLSIQLGWSSETRQVMASNNGPEIEIGMEIDGVESTGTPGSQCSASYLNVSEFNPDWAPTQFSGWRALFDGVSIEPSAHDIERLRAGEEVLLSGGVRFKALSECCVGNSGFLRIGAEFDVRATAEIRLTPRR